MVITRGRDHCLYVYSRKEWEKQAARYAAQANGNAASRGLARLFLAGSFEGELDGAGRVLVPENLKDFAGIKGKAVIAGVADHAEIWEEDAWKAYTKGIERDADQYAETLGAAN